MVVLPAGEAIPAREPKGGKWKEFADLAMRHPGQWVYCGIARSRSVAYEQGKRWGVEVKTRGLGKIGRAGTGSGQGAHVWVRWRYADERRLGG